MNKTLKVGKKTISSKKLPNIEKDNNNGAKKL